MKLNGFVGKGSGKLGASVFAISGGEQIVRLYNPQVTNPNTDAQVAQRAKLKLMSQLAAALAPALGFAKRGLISARNQFVSKNIGQATFVNDEASIDITELSLTPSGVSFPLVTGNVADGTLSLTLGSAASADVKRVAYFVYKQTNDDKLEYVASKIVTEAGEGRTFPTTFQLADGEYVVYAYGIKDNSANATMRYEDYATSQGGENATLGIIEMFRSTDYALTKSSAMLVNVG